MLVLTNRALKPFFNETAQQKNNAVAEGVFMMGVNQNLEVTTYTDSFELNNHYTKSLDISGSGIKLACPLRS